MKKLLFALVVAGLWFASSKSYTEREAEMKAIRAVDPAISKYRNTQMAKFYTGEYQVIMRDMKAQLEKFTREFTRLAPQAAHIDPKNGPRVIELGHALSKAQEAASAAVNELYQYLTVKSAAMNQEKTN